MWTVVCYEVARKAAGVAVQAGARAARAAAAHAPRRLAVPIGPRRPRPAAVAGEVAAAEGRRRVRRRAAAGLACFVVAAGAALVPWGEGPWGYGLPGYGPAPGALYGFPQVPLAPFPVAMVLPPESVVEGREHLPLPTPGPEAVGGPPGAPTPVPEPSGLALLGVAVAALLLRKGRLPF